MLKIKPKTERLDGELQKLRQTKDKSSAGKRTKLTEQKTKLLEPVNRIFEKELKPRLEKLPTRAQRKAAEATSNLASSGAPKSWSA